MASASTDPPPTESPETKKETPTKEAPNELEAKILRQVEFYFSDSNLPKDKFLKGLINQNQGWVPIPVIASFKRMRQLTTDVQVVVNALRKSASLLEVNPEGDKMRRITPLPENIDQISLKRTIHAKGLPAESTIESVTEYFNQHGKVVCVRLIRLNKSPEKKFKGSVFVELSSEEEAKKVSGLELKNSEGNPLILSLKTAWLQKKKAERDTKQKENGGEQQGQKSKKRKGEKHGKKPKNKKVKEEGGENKENKENNGEDKKEEKQEPEELRFKKNLLIKISNVKENTSREHLKEFFTELKAHVAFIDFQRTSSSGIVRLNEDDECGASGIIVKAKESTANINEKPAKEITFVALEGTEEEDYWKLLQSKKKQTKDQRGGNKRKKNFKKGGRKQKLVLDESGETARKKTKL